MFTGFTVTNAGKALLAKVLTGESLEFTRVQIGSGELGEGADLKSATSLIAPIKFLSIMHLRRENNMASVAFQITNAGTQGFTLREVGLFARDPDDGEILYAYTNAGAEPEIVPEPSVTAIEYIMSFDTVVSDTANVTAIIDGSLIYVTEEMMQAALQEKSDNEHSHDIATKTAPGFMSVNDRNKLDGIAEGATKYAHPKYTAQTIGFYKVNIDAQGHVSMATPVTKNDITMLGIPAQDTTYGSATASRSGLMTAADKKKLNGIAENATNYSHPAYTAHGTGFYKVAVDAQGHVNSVTPISKSDITDLGIPAQDTTYGVVTQSNNGLMTAADKAKLDGIAAKATNYSHPSHTARANGFYKVTVDSQGHVTGATAVSKSDITKLGIPAQDTTYGVASESANGLMAAEDKVRLGKTVLNTGDTMTGNLRFTPAGGVVFLNEGAVEENSRIFRLGGTEPLVFELQNAIGGSVQYWLPAADETETARIAKFIATMPDVAMRVDKNGDTMGGELALPSLRVQPKSGVPFIVMGVGKDEDMGEILLDSELRRLYFRHHASDTDFFEQFLLPIPSSGLTANKSYHVITSKNPKDGRTKLGIQSGISPEIISNANAVTYQQITFPTAFESAPLVVASFINTSEVGDVGKCVPAVDSITQFGFKLKIHNADSSKRTVTVAWIAVER